MFMRRNVLVLLKSLAPHGGKPSKHLKCMLIRTLDCSLVKPGQDHVMLKIMLHTTLEMLEYIE